MIHAAILGLGRWGRGLVESVQNISEQIQFTHALVQSNEKHQAFADKNNLCLTNQYADILGNSSIELVVIATPHTMHIDQIIAAASAGKHILCEKPLALTVMDAQRAVEVCRQAGVRLGVGHDKRFWPSMRELKAELLRGSLGELIHIEGNFSNENSRLITGGWRNTPENAPGGSITATGIHLVDAFVNLMGPLNSVQGHYVVHSNKNEFSDSMSLLCNFKSGATGVMSSVRPTPVFWNIHIYGTLGSIEARGPNNLILFRSGKPVEIKEFPAINALRAQLDTMARCIQESLPYPMSDEQMINTVEAFVASARAIDSGQIVHL
jgi:predicted dehydrogenase